MKKHGRRFRVLAAYSSMFAATVFGAFHAQAATLGHSRVVSASNEPLRIVVQLKELSSTSLQSLSAQIAPEKAWQEAGLTPPVGLSSLSVHLLPGHQAQLMQLVIQSDLVATDKVVDVLVDIKTASSTQRHQVSILQAQQGAPVRLAATRPAGGDANTTPPSVTASTATITENPQTIKVKKGQYLYAIARQHQQENYSDQQFMAALVQANPNAFIQGNMNLLRAGASLTVPSVETITAISPQQARQFYQEQLKQFDEYRQRIAKGESPLITPTPSEAPKVEAKELKVSTDRLQLSAQSDDAKKDQQTATTQELAHTAQRLSQLESAPKEPIEITEVATNSGDGSISGGSELTNSSLVGSTTPPTSTVAAVAPTANAAVPPASPSPTADQVDDKPHASTSLWWKSKGILISLGLLLLVAGLVAWLLRRVQSTRMEYAEMVTSNSVRTREKVDPDEVEFREIK